LAKCAAETSAIAWYSAVLSPLPRAPPGAASASVVIPGRSSDRVAFNMARL